MAISSAEIFFFKLATFSSETWHEATGFVAKQDNGCVCRALVLCIIHTLSSHLFLNGAGIGIN